METNHAVTTIKMGVLHKENKLHHILRHLCHLQQKKRFILGVPMHTSDSNQCTDSNTKPFHFITPLFCADFLEVSREEQNSGCVREKSLFCEVFDNLAQRC